MKYIKYENLFYLRKAHQAYSEERPEHLSLKPSQ